MTSTLLGVEFSSNTTFNLGEFARLCGLGLTRGVINPTSTLHEMHKYIHTLMSLLCIHINIVSSQT